MSVAGLVDQLERPDVLAAIRALDCGYKDTFAESTKFDLLFEGKRYPPKRVVGVAVELAHGQPLRPYSFKGGLASKCFKTLARCGFAIVRKEQLPTLHNDLAEAFAIPLVYNTRHGPEIIEAALQSSCMGQGRGLSKPEQVAVELHAMELARGKLEGLGFEAIADTSRGNPFDFAALRDGEEWLIEVKGTTSESGDVVLMTANEVDLHHRRRGRTVLVIVHQIDLDRAATPPGATGGVADIYAPWNPCEWDFAPTMFRVSRAR